MNLDHRARAAVDACTAYLTPPATITPAEFVELHTAAQRALDRLSEAIEDQVDVYPVGLFRDVRQLRHALAVGDPRAWRRLRSALGRQVDRIRGRRWREARQYLNGYLAEHRTSGTRCGHGWTPGRARRDLAAHLYQLGRAGR
ncbi:hypothetical protein OOJ91_34030 [Micromonospora lupini]|uniref:hypothetical protein n=1 Tax=Micromonospora lupini TaxID=285679 RepID=UPI002258EBF4|nr:hypothetical protein [Micromonospora lupini]MCX5070868.1 hypothetical protein [Micromonospora lupini]